MQFLEDPDINYYVSASLFTQLILHLSKIAVQHH